MSIKVGDVVQIGQAVRRLVRSLPNDPGGWEVDRPIRGNKYFSASEFGKPVTVTCAKCNAHTTTQEAWRIGGKSYCGPCAAML